MSDATTTPVTLTVNGAEHRIEVEPRVTLLDALREVIGLTGTKKGCDRGECGACTVHADGRRINACMTLAVMAEGTQITTIEGLAGGDTRHPVQRAFVDNDGFQCGYCTPGQVMSAAACVAEGHAGSDEEIREWMSGNICRCGAYAQIVAAVRDAARMTGKTAERESGRATDDAVRDAVPAGHQTSDRVSVRGGGREAADA